MRCDSIHFTGYKNYFQAQEKCTINLYSRERFHVSTVKHCFIKLHGSTMKYEINMTLLYIFMLIL